MPNPYKVNSTEWAAHEKQTAFKGMATNSYVNAAELHRLKEMKRSTRAATFSNPAVAPSVGSHPTISNDIARTLSKTLILFCFLGPAAISAGLSQGSVLLGILVFVLGGAAFGRLAEFRLIDKALALTGWLLIGAVGLQVLVWIDIGGEDLTAFVSGMTAWFMSLIQSYLSLPFVQETLAFFGL